MIVWVLIRENRTHIIIVQWITYVMTRAITNSWPTPFHLQTIAWDDSIFVDDGCGCYIFDSISFSQKYRCVLTDIASKDGNFIPLLNNGNNFSYFVWSRTPVYSTSKLTLVVFFVNRQTSRGSNQRSKRFRCRRDSSMSRPIRAGAAEPLSPDAMVMMLCSENISKAQLHWLFLDKPRALLFESALGMIQKQWKWKFRIWLLD